jgi:hypothetical protein
MKHTEEQILVIAKKVLQNLEKEYYNEENITKLMFDGKQVLSRGENKDQEHPCWVVCVNEPVFDTSQFLTISDETGEPLYMQVSWSVVIEIEKDEDGNYRKKE